MNDTKDCLIEISCQLKSYYNFLLFYFADLRLEMKINRTESNLNEFFIENVE